jgi:hypothetical protein
MKSTITIVVIMLAGAICAPAADKKKDPPAPQALTIPKDAVPNSDGISYIYTDKQGKRWVYAKTPFGLTKFPASDAPMIPQDLSTTKAIDKGDTVRFERPGPFGTMTWEKKKADLTDDERHLLEVQNAKTEQK